MRRILIVGAILAFASSASAQVNKSNLTGIVRDATGAAVPQVAIKLTNIGTGAVRSELSDASGFYRFTLVDRGILGDPDKKKICTSHVERQNLSIRMGMRRLTRLTNAFSKKWENLWAAYCLWFAFYNFVRVHQTLRVTPAMEAGSRIECGGWQSC